MVLVLLGCYLVLLMTDFRKYRPRFSLLTVSILLFWLSFAISTFAGVDWYRSFWDNHERMLGLFTLIHYFLFYLVVTTVLRDQKDWNFLLRFVMVASSLVMVVGILQRTILPDLFLNGGNSRVSATLGNPIYLGGYGLFLAFLGVYLFFKEEKRKAKIMGILLHSSGW